MLVVHGTFHVDPRSLDKLRTILAPLLQATREEAGCVSYDWAQSLDDPGTFYSVEVWRSPQDSDAHMKSEQTTAAFADMPALLIGEPQVVGFDGGDQVDLLR